MSELATAVPTVIGKVPLGKRVGVCVWFGSVAGSGTLYQPRPPLAFDWLSTSVAWKLQSGMKVDGVMDALATALMFSLTEVKYCWSVVASMVTVAGTAVPFGSTTWAVAFPPTTASARPTTADPKLEFPKRRAGLCNGALSLFRKLRSHSVPAASSEPHRPQRPARVATSAAVGSTVRLAGFISEARSLDETWTSPNEWPTSWAMVMASSSPVRSSLM